MQKRPVWHELWQGGLAVVLMKRSEGSLASMREVTQGQDKRDRKNREHRKVSYQSKRTKAGSRGGVRVKHLGYARRCHSRQKCGQ